MQPLQGLHAGLAAAVTLSLALAGAPALAADCSGLAGQYLFDIHNPALTAAIKMQAGNARRRFDNRYEVQVPFESTGNGYVHAAACMAHSCSIEEAFLGIQESTCKVFIALLEDGKFTLVSPKSGWPHALDQARKDWMANR